MPATDTPQIYFSVVESESALDLDILTLNCAKLL